ncbi:MAG: hypothetical protein RL095_411 [Verrucomicrobiota bacterium]|jgi:hypothetical protein
MPESLPTSASPVQVLRELRRGEGWRIFLGRDIAGGTWEIEEVVLGPAAEAHAQFLHELAKAPPSGIPWRLPQKIFQDRVCWQFWRPCIDAAPLCEVLARPPLPPPEISLLFLGALEKLAASSPSLNTPSAAALLPNLLLGHDGSLYLDSPRCGAWLDPQKLTQELWPYLPQETSRALPQQILEMRNRIALRLLAGDPRPPLARIPASLPLECADFVRRCLPDPSADLRPMRLDAAERRASRTLLPALIAALLFILALYWKSGEAEAAWEGLAGLAWQGRQDAGGLSAEAEAASQGARAADKRLAAEILRSGELGDFRGAQARLGAFAAQDARLAEDAEKSLRKLLADDFQRSLLILREARGRADFPRAKAVLDDLIARYPPGQEWNEAMRLSKEMVDERLAFETAAAKRRTEIQEMARAEWSRFQRIEEALRQPLKDPQRDLKQRLEALVHEAPFHSEAGKTLISLHQQLAEAELKLWGEIFAWAKKADAASLQEALLAAIISTPGSAEAISPLGIRYSTAVGGGNFAWSQVTPKQLAALHRVSCGDSQDARLLRAQLLLRHGTPYPSAAEAAGPDFLAFAALAEARKQLENEGR